MYRWSVVARNEWEANATDHRGGRKDREQPRCMRVQLIFFLILLFVNFYIILRNLKPRIVLFNQSKCMSTDDIDCLLVISLYFFNFVLKFIS